MKADAAILDRSYLRRLELGRKLTGRGVLVWMVVGFGVMFAANFALIYIALSTLHGEELENPYDASQVYNQHLAEARAQDQLGWSVNISSRQENGGVRIVADFRDRQDATVDGLEVKARFLHPFDRAQDQEALLANDGGDYEGFAAGVHSGRWQLEIVASRNGQVKFRSENKLTLSEAQE